MKEVMQAFRTSPPESLAGNPVAQVRDYLNLTVCADGEEQELIGPRGDLVMLDLAASGNYAAVRPSGTEPKIKFYLFAYEPAEQIADLADTRAELERNGSTRCTPDLKAAAGVT